MNLLVVTPTLGQSPWLAETVASVARCAREAQHVLVAPAAETARLAARFPGTNVITESAPGKGLYAAINSGLAQTGGWDAFTYLNDDDVLRPGFARVLAGLDAERGASLGYGRVELIDGRGQLLGAIPVSSRPRNNRALYAQRLEPVYQHGSVVTRAAWENVGGFDETFRLCGDSEYLARLCLRGVKATYFPCVVAAFRLHGSQLTKGRAAMVAERRQVDAKLNLLADRPDRLARMSFRFANLPVYLDRIRRHGWLSFDELLERGGRDAPPQA